MAKSLTFLKGSCVEMRRGQWYPCNDVNRELSRDGITAIAVVLVDLTINAGEGAEPKDLHTFCLRQYYQNGRPTLDYTERSRQEWLEGIEKFQSPERRRAIELVLLPACKEFETKYANREADLEALAGILVGG